MSGPVKLSMLTETYLSGLRTLNVFFSIINTNSDFLLNQLEYILSKHKKVEEEKAEKAARQLLFAICSQISFTFIKKVSDSIGSNKFIDKFPIIEQNNNFSSVKLINFLVKLDHLQGFPERDLKQIKQYIERYPLSYFVLKRMVLNYLHRHPVDYKDKQRICSFLSIDIETQIKIEASITK